MHKPHKITRRAQDIQPFQVMDILAQAKVLQSQGRDIIHLKSVNPTFRRQSPWLRQRFGHLKTAIPFTPPRWV